MDRLRPQESLVKLKLLLKHKSLRGMSFAFEATVSGRGYARLIPGWQMDGYIVKLFFLRLGSPELVIARVRQRVREGGHMSLRRSFTAVLWQD
jgi:predicted ABC-type ATPase